LLSETTGFSLQTGNVGTTRGGYFRFRDLTRFTRAWENLQELHWVLQDPPG
jgi:hypothetical protein